MAVETMIIMAILFYSPCVRLSVFIRRSLTFDNFGFLIISKGIDLVVRLDWF